MTTKTKSRMIDGLTVNIKDFAVIDGGGVTLVDGD